MVEKPDKSKKDKKATEPKSKPKDAKPKDSKPKASKPKASKPKDSKPKAQKPKVAKPKTIKPKTTKGAAKTGKAVKPAPKKGDSKAVSKVDKSKKSVAPKKDLKKGAKNAKKEVKKKGAVQKRGGIVKKKTKITTYGSFRYGRKKRAIIKKILHPHTRRVKRRTTSIAPSPKVQAPGSKPAKKVVKTLQKKRTPCKLKKSLSPGVVCIVVAGPHKGKRVIFLKQLRSGLCLITGPFIFNRCPLRRINQIYLMATTTKVNLNDVNVPNHINDEYFRRIKAAVKKPKKEEGDIFTQKPIKYHPSKLKRNDQKKVDKCVLKCIKKRSDSKSLSAYLTTKFSLKNREYPHLLKF